MTIYYHSLPLGAAKKAVEDGELLSHELQWKKEMNWDSLSSEEKREKMDFFGKSFDKKIETEEDFFRLLNSFPDHEYESRFQNLTFTKSLDQSLVYSVRHETPGVILGLEFTDNGRTWIKAPRKSLDDLKEVILNPTTEELQTKVRELFNKYNGVEFYTIKQNQ